VDELQAMPEVRALEHLGCADHGVAQLISALDVDPQSPRPQHVKRLHMRMSAKRLWCSPTVRMASRLSKPNSGPSVKNASTAQLISSTGAGQQDGRKPR